MAVGKRPCLEVLRDLVAQVILGAQSSKQMEKGYWKLIDIHTHILPEIDDGADSLEEAYEMALMAVRSGVKALVATPHSNQGIDILDYEKRKQEQAFLELEQVLLQEKVPLKLYRGMEIWSSIDMVEKIQSGKLLTLNQTPYVLIEFAFDEEPWWIEAIIDELKGAGLIAILAHPERYFCVQDDPNLLYEWRLQGAQAQMNKGSILGRFGMEIERTAEILLEKRLFTCIASDAHHAYLRTTDMKELQYYLQRHYSLEEQDRLLRQNPLSILQGMKIKNNK